MNIRLRLWLLPVLLATLAACAKPTPTPPPPTPVPTPTPVLATRAEQIVGTWFGTAADGMYQRFNLDGTNQVARSLDNLNSSPGSEQTFRFEGTQLIMTEVKATSLPSCGANKTATYQVQLLPNGNIKFVKVQDACAPRARSTAQEHKPVR